MSRARARGEVSRARARGEVSRARARGEVSRARARAPAASTALLNKQASREGRHTPPLMYVRIRVSSRLLIIFDPYNQHTLYVIIACTMTV